MRLTHREKEDAVRAYLERHCVGWERRRLGAVIVAHLGHRGVRMSEQALQHITKVLRTSGLLVCTDDTKGTGGYFIAACRREADEYVQQLEGRIKGTVETQNYVRKLRDEKFPRPERPAPSVETAGQVEFAFGGT